MVSKVYFDEYEAGSREYENSPNYVYHLMDNLEPQKPSGTRGQMS